MKPAAIKKYVVMVAWYDTFCDVWIVEATDREHAIQRVKDLAATKRFEMGRDGPEDYTGAFWDVAELPAEEGIIDFQNFGVLAGEELT